MVAEPSDSVQILDGGSVAFPSMLAAIAQAERTIYIEVYAFFLDEIGSRFIAALGEALKRSVTVRVIIDGLGSRGHSAGVQKALLQVGCEVSIYHPIWSALYGRFRRNHRKILLIDDRVAFVGGINIGMPYHGDSTTDYADLAVQIEGPACAQLARALDGKSQQGDSAIRFFLSRHGGSFRLRRRYIKAIGRAQKRILLAHGYFLPDRRLLRSITAAARRGVEVILLVAGHSDIPFFQAATANYYARLLRSGVQIFEWQSSVLHSKVATIDDQRLLIGSFNLDPLSLLNLEILVEIRQMLAVSAASTWIQSRLALGRRVALAELRHPSLLRRLVLLIGFLGTKFAHAMRRVITSRAP